MSGHSKWATIKRKKEKTDSQRAKAFTKVTREIIIATKAGGPDPDGNFRLRLAVQNAKAINMPNDNIQRAIKRGAGESDAEAFDEVIYEGYGPGGCALLVQVLTDNRNRTASDMRYIFSRNNGNLGEAGCVAWMFDQKGIIEIPMDKVNLTEDELLTLAMEAGAEDAKIGEEAYEITMAPADLESVRKYLETQNMPYSRAELTMIPKSTVEVTGEAVRDVMKLVDLLEEHEDVQNVYGNFEIDDEEMEKYME